MEVALEEDLVGPSPVTHVVRQADLLRLVDRPSLAIIPRRRPFLHEVRGDSWSGSSRETAVRRRRSPTPPREPRRGGFAECSTLMRNP